jgi:hypothetical protein
MLMGRAIMICPLRWQFLLPSGRKAHRPAGRSPAPGPHTPNLQQGRAEEPGNPVIPAGTLQLSAQEILQWAATGRVALNHKAIWLFPRSSTEIFSGASITICLVIIGYPCINDEANNEAKALVCFIVCSIIASDA